MNEEELKKEYAVYCFQQLGMDIDEYIDTEHLTFEEWKARRVADGKSD